MATTTPVPPAASNAGPPEADPVAQTLALIRPWIDYVPPQQRRLGLFIFFALLAHLTVFFFITIDTTRAELRHQLRPHVTVEDMQSQSVSGSQPGDDFWDKLNDPRLYLLPQPSQMSVAANKQALDFIAMGDNLGSSDLPPSAPPEGVQFIHPVNPPLDQQVEESMVPTRQPFTYSETPPAILPNTAWQWDAALATRQPAGFPELPSPISDTDLNPTQMRIAVGPGGEVEHVLVEQSCGKAQLDQQAALAARKIRFRSTDQTGLLWGQITVFWHYAAKPLEEVVPTPPSTP
jgi:TonB family protein